MEKPQEILKQEFEKRRKRNPNFSLRSFAKWLGISPAQLSQMMTGKRSVTVNSAKIISEKMNLSPVEKRIFLNSCMKNKEFIEINSEKKTLHMQEDQFRLISDWYHFAILSLTKIKGAKADPRWIARRLGINVDEAHQAILRMERMGILQLKPVFQQVCEPIQVVSNVSSQAIQKHHKQILNLAAEKIETIAVSRREYQSISIPLNPQHIPIFKKHIDDFLEEAAKMSDPKNGTEIYAVNVQLFPLTKTEETTK